MKHLLLAPLPFAYAIISLPVVGLPEPRIVWLKDYVPLDVYNNQRLRLIEKGKAKGKPISPKPANELNSQRQQ